ncbi:hypothetical protein FS842_008339 [Serendipita sp. 407]|nr:hypothetical protein FS842_008339 [Serendipita sp. 407]
MRHFIQEVGSYPFSSYKLVFVDELIGPRHDGATMCLASIDLLHTEDAVDPVFESRLILSQAVAVQWFGVNIYQRTWSDTWLVNGLASYISGSFIRKHLGNNEYRFRLKKDILRVVDLDVGEMPPICQPGLLEPTDPAYRQFINLKAPLVLHILDRRMHKTGTSQGLHRIIPKIILDALENENAAAVSTHSFLRMCRKTAGLDFRPFAEQWVYGSGCPRFSVRSHFNRKKMAVEMHVKQESIAYEANKDDPVSLALLRPMPFFDGQMTIRIHEADGTPYEHVLDIRQPYKKFEVPFNTKYKRVRRNTKRFIARQQAAEAAANPETAELIGVVDMSFGLGIWEDDASREEWKVADWSESDEAHMATATYEEDLFKNELVPRPNDFSDFSEYFLRKALITALSQVRLENGETLPIVRRFLIDQLRYNDNSTNSFSDSYYIAHIIGALGCALVSTTPPERAELQGDHIPQVVEDPRAQIDRDILNGAIAEVDRYRDLDRVIPSWRNAITVATLEFRMMLMMANGIPSDPAFFLLYTREGNSTPVRVAAFDGLFLTKWYSPEVFKYLMAVVSRDSSRIVSRHVASNMCESLAIQFSIGDIKMPAKEPEPILIEEDATKPEVVKEPKKSEVDVMIKTLRKDKEIGRNPVLRKIIMPMMLNSSLDHEVRWSLLKLADLCFRAVEEPLPKVTIHIPVATPIEAPSKKLKLSLSIGGGPSGAPSPRVAPDGLSAVSTPAVGQSTPVVPKIVLKARDPSLAPPTPAPVAPKQKAGAAWAKSGLSSQEKKMIDAILKRVNAHPAAVWFLTPVDPVSQGIPTYFDVVKNPMDLATMTSKLKTGQYSNRQDFADDFKLMLSNAFLFNPAGTPPHDDALKVEGLFNKLWKTTDDAVEKDNKAKVKLSLKPREPGNFVPIRPVPVPQKAKPPPPQQLPLPPPPPPPPVRERDLDEELLEAVDAPEDLGGDEDAPFDEDVDDLLLGSTSIAPMTPPKLKLKASRRPAPDMDDDETSNAVDDLESALWDAAEASSITKPERFKSVDTGGRASPVPKIKVSLGKQNRPTATPPLPAVSEPSSSRQYETPHAAPRREDSVSSTQMAPNDHPGSRKRASGGPEIEDASNIPVDPVKCKALIQKLSEVPYGWIFVAPVDSTQPGLESYYEEIKQPMDYQTMTRKVDRKKYSSMEDFADDLRLIYTNGRKFNASSPEILDLIDSLEIVWKKEWPGMLKKRLPTDAKKQLLQAVAQIRTDDVNMIFHNPVDPIALGIPHYFDVIPREDARDLTTIKSRIDKGLYQSPEQVDQDVKLMFSNAYKFNGRDSPISSIASALEQTWSRLYAKARVAGEGGGSNSKKPRLA